jgi:hypothetical protein
MNAKAALLIVPFALAACDPQSMADNVSRRAAADVVEAVVVQDMPAPAAKAATECILQAATVEETRALAADYGVIAGNGTVQNVRNLALRPAAQSCFAASGVPPVK